MILSLFPFVVCIFCFLFSHGYSDKLIYLFFSLYILLDLENQFLSMNTFIRQLFSILSELNTSISLQNFHIFFIGTPLYFIWSRCYKELKRKVERERGKEKDRRRKKGDSRYIQRKIANKKKIVYLKFIFIFHILFKLNYFLYIFIYTT